jgi:enoyl-CoA hydratase
MTSDLVVRTEGRAGRITLDRPELLNALNAPMVAGLTRALEAWRDDPAVALVIVDATGDKAFCAGGDIQSIYRTGRSRPQETRRFWVEEYRLNALINAYPKPYVAIMDGIVMGGGVGISAHGSHRIVTERTSVTMPEASIGFLPDVGGTWLLSRAPGRSGFYLGLTATRMSPGDAIHAGFADSFVPKERLADLVRALVETGDPAVIATLAEKAPDSQLASLRAPIDLHFGQQSVLDIVRSLEGSAGPFEREAADRLRYVSPLSAAATFEAIDRARKAPDLESCLVTEYRFAFRCLEGHDFYEGIRATVIDKDRKPHWSPRRIEDVSPESVMAAFEPLPDREEWRPAQ